MKEEKDRVRASCALLRTISAWNKTQACQQGFHVRRLPMRRDGLPPCNRNMQSELILPCASRMRLSERSRESRERHRCEDLSNMIRSASFLLLVQWTRRKATGTLFLKTLKDSKVREFAFLQATTATVGRTLKRRQHYDMSMWQLLQAVMLW